MGAPSVIGALTSTFPRRENVNVQVGLAALVDDNLLVYGLGFRCDWCRYCCRRRHLRVCSSQRSGRGRCSCRCRRSRRGRNSGSRNWCKRYGRCGCHDSRSGCRRYRRRGCNDSRRGCYSRRWCHSRYSRRWSGRYRRCAARLRRRGRGKFCRYRLPTLALRLDHWSGRSDRCGTSYQPRLRSLYHHVIIFLGHRAAAHRDNLIGCEAIRVRLPAAIGVNGGGEVQFGTVVQLKRLHGSRFAGSVSAEKPRIRTAMESNGDGFGGARRAAIHQNRHWSRGRSMQCRFLI
jgi:hypothetical protein